MLLGRITWIDVACGIGIILVIQGHALSADSYRHFIYAFHLPLFFFLSGIVFNYKKYDFLTTFKKSARGILVPYVFFALLSYAFWWTENSGFRFDFISLLHHLSGIIYGNSSSLFFNIVLWFLPCLFITKIAFAFFSRIIKKEYILVVFIIVLSVVGYYMFIFLPDLVLPFGIESALTAIVFFALGSIIATSYFEKLNRFIKNRAYALLASAFLITMVAAAINFALYGVQIDIRLNNLGNYFIFYIGAISGILVTIIVSILINKNLVLEKLGNSSLVLFSFHPIVFFYITKVMLIFISSSVLYQMKDYYLSPFFTIFAIVIILAIVFVIKKIRPVYFL